jgi:hypothetical protein
MTNPATESAYGEEPEEIPEEIPVETPATESASTTSAYGAGVEAPAIKSVKAPRTQKQLDVLALARVKAAETIQARKASREALRKSPQVLSESPQVLSESPQVLSESPQVLSESPQILSESPSISKKPHRQDIKRSVTMSMEELDYLIEESSTRTYNKLKTIVDTPPKLVYNAELGVYTYQP